MRIFMVVFFTTALAVFNLLLIMIHFLGQSLYLDVSCDMNVAD